MATSEQVSFRATIIKQTDSGFDALAAGGGGEMGEHRSSAPGWMGWQERGGAWSWVGLESRFIFVLIFSCFTFKFVTSVVGKFKKDAVRKNPAYGRH